MKAGIYADTRDSLQRSVAPELMESELWAYEKYLRT